MFFFNSKIGLRCHIEHTLSHFLGPKTLILDIFIDIIRRSRKYEVLQQKTKMRQNIVGVWRRNCYFCQTE